MNQILTCPICGWDEETPIEESPAAPSRQTEEVEKERMERLAPEFLSLLEQYAKEPELLEGLEGACVAIVNQEVRSIQARNKVLEGEVKRMGEAISVEPCSCSDENDSCHKCSYVSSVLDSLSPATRALIDSPKSDASS
ncbi:carboxypeptidase M32 [Blastopirellula marina]|uniref:carboxypeptidase M32 n=1 Tax=Blastopirellula marina TaxID=124 RepID=UPI0011B05266|nr:carboxypeptidase M32 [Blastopirellula marina]